MHCPGRVMASGMLRLKVYGSRPLDLQDFLDGITDRGQKNCSIRSNGAP